MKKKIISAALIAALVAGSMLCAVNEKKVEAKSGQSLVVSFVHRNNIGDTSDMDLDAISSATVYTGSTGEKKSTIEVIRDTVKKQTGAKSFAIKVKTPYSRDYSTTVDKADKEIDDDTNVKLVKSKVSGLKKYDTVYLCTPIWHVDLPQPVRVFLRSNDWSGKKIYVFGAHLGSGFGSNIDKVKELCPGATVIKAKTYRGDAKNSSVKKSVKSWLKKNTGNNEKAKDMIYAHIGNETLSIKLADNSSAKAFYDIIKKNDVTVKMHDYGGFEKVGGLGSTIERNDESITTEPGDVILYQGNQVTIYYDTNTWSFTRLGKVQGLSKSQLKDVLGDGDVTVVFSVK